MSRLSCYVILLLVSQHIELDRSFLAIQGITVPLDVVKRLHSSELWTNSHNQFCVTGWNYATRGCLRASNCLFSTSCDKTFTSAGHFLKFQGHSRPLGSALWDLEDLQVQDDSGSYIRFAQVGARRKAQARSDSEFPGKVTAIPGFLGSGCCDRHVFSAATNWRGMDHSPKVAKNVAVDRLRFKPWSQW